MTNRYTARIIVTMRHQLISRTISEMMDKHDQVADDNASMDALAKMLPLRLQTVRSLQKYVGKPARRMIERDGLLAYSQGFDL